MFELAIAVGVIQWFVARERAKEREPIQRQAVTHAASVIRGASNLVQIPLATFRKAEGLDGLSDEELLRQHPDLFARLDLDADAAVFPPRPLGAFLAESRRQLEHTYSLTADTIAAYCPRELALAVQTLFDGEGRLFLLFCSVCEVSKTADMPYPRRSGGTDSGFTPFVADVARAQAILAKVKQQRDEASSKPG